MDFFFLIFCNYSYLKFEFNFAEFNSFDDDAAILKCVRN